MFASRSSLIGIVILIGASMSVSAQITVRLSHKIDPQTVWISVGGRGQIDGVRWSMDLANKKSFEIVKKPGETSLTATKLLIHSSLYLAHAYEFSDADNGKELNVVLVPRRQLPFRGRVIMGKHPLEGAQVTIGYMQLWYCNFFVYIECPGGYRPVARARVDKNGSFTAKLPDFATDPAVERFSGRTAFRLAILDPRTGNGLYVLQPQPGEDEMNIKPTYDREQVFTVRKWVE